MALEHEPFAQVRNQWDLLRMLPDIPGVNDTAKLWPMAEWVITHCGSEYNAFGVLNIVEGTLGHAVTARGASFSIDELRELVPATANAVMTDPEIAARSSNMILESLGITDTPISGEMTTAP